MFSKKYQIWLTRTSNLQKELDVNAEGSDNIHALYIYFLIFRVLDSSILIF